MKAIFVIGEAFLASGMMTIEDCTFYMMRVLQGKSSDVQCQLSADIEPSKKVKCHTLTFQRGRILKYDRITFEPVYLFELFQVS